MSGFVKLLLTKATTCNIMFASGFLHNEIIATQVMEAGRELDLRIPQGFAVVGYDEDIVASLLTPPLTAVRQQTRETGAREVRMPLDMLNGKSIEQRQVFP